MKTNILLINGPNLNMLGIRKPEIYGATTLAEIESELISYGNKKECLVSCFQSNHEGAIIDALHSAYGKIDGIIINPGAYTHYSYAIRDAIESVMIPAVEVHISDIHNREDFRSKSVIEPVSLCQISGHGKEGYFMALDRILDYLNQK
ncbi:MAG: type II 3-dehydroquinate dehydratase [Ruminococcaceae bacterium]|nr:type II 3-dehydroquinate dehydratase [Oscillospiraceae bacterium]